LRGSVVQESGFVVSKLADLETHVEHVVVALVAQKSEVPFEALHGSWEVEVKSKSAQNAGLQLNQTLLGNLLLLLCVQEVDHSCEAWRNGLLELGRHQDGNGGKSRGVLLQEVAVENVDVSIKDS